MKILMIQPPVQDFYQTKIRTYPLGLLYLAGTLQAHNFEVSILDAHIPSRKRTIPLPKKFDYIRKYYSLENKSPFGLFSQYYHFGLSFEEIREEIEKQKPDVVGISSLFTPYSQMALTIAQITKQVNQKTITVVGGHHAWAMPKIVLQNPDVDYIIRGEAEYAFTELCQLIEKSRNPQKEQLTQIRGVGFDDFIHEKFAIVEDLDTLAFPARNFISSKDYQLNSKSYAMIQTSRGCPYSCGFCAIASTPCKQYRTRSFASLTQEIEECIHTHGISHFDITDDNFTFNKDHAHTILDIFSSKKHTPITLSAMNGISSHDLDNSLIDSMKYAGFSHIDLALVSKNSQTRNNVTRPGDLDHFSSMLSHTIKQGLTTTVHIIVGMPNDSQKNIMDSLHYLNQYDCTIGASIYYPVPGSTLFPLSENEFFVNDYEAWRLTLASTENFKGHRDEYMTIFYLVRIINYVKSLQRIYNKKDQPFIPTITSLYEQLISQNEKSTILESNINRSTPWSQNELGIVMLYRFLQQKKIEKVSMQTSSNTTNYQFENEFCPQEIIDSFVFRLQF